MFELVEEHSEELNVRVLGVGTAGCKILESLDVEYIEKVFISRKPIHSKEPENCTTQYIHLGNDDAHSIAGNPNRGYQLALSNEEVILNSIKDADIVYVICCLGGSGGGIAQYIVEQLKTLDILSIGLVSIPFNFEGDRKNNIARANYNRLSQNLDSIILVENDKHLNLLSSNNTSDLFLESNRLFSRLINSMLSLVNEPCLINVDFKDLVTVMKNMGASTLGFGRSNGETGRGRAVEAVERVFSSALFEYEGLASAKGFIVNITAGMDISIDEFEQVGNAFKAKISEDATVVIGAVIDPEYVEDIEVTIISSGFEKLIIEPEIEEYDFAEIYRTIEFSPENLNAGLSILSYFEQVLKQRYKDIAATVRIEQNRNTVKLVIQTKDGNVDIIERALSDFGEVVKGDLQAEQILSDPLDIERLNMKLEIASLELRQNQKIISLYKSEASQSLARIENLETQVRMLNEALCNGLSQSQKTLDINLNRSNDVVSSIMDLIDEVVKRELTKDDEKLLKNKIEEAHKLGFSISEEIEALIKNTIYGVSSNSVFNYLQSVLIALPK